MTSETKQPAKPVSARERIDFVDILRGFALLGVFTFNMWGFAGDRFGLMTWPHWWDRALVIARDFLIQAKFYSLFSFLFGWGMSIQLLRAQQRGTKFLTVYLRRLLILLLLGMAHGILIWDGDILTLYAMMGFLLVLFRNRSPRFLWVTAVLLLLFSIFMTLPYTGVTAIREWYGELTAIFHWRNLGPAPHADGTWVEIARHRAQSFVSRNTDGLIYVFGNILSMFLLGLYTGKRQIFQNVDQHRPFLRRVMVSGLILGVLLNGAFVFNIYWRETGLPDWYPAQFAWTIHTGTRTFGAPALMLFYVSGLTLLLQREKWRARLAPLGSVGRMALSNYLTQSVLGTLIFYGYGLGLYGRTAPIFGVILVIIIFLAQIRFSAWWLERYQFGPMEWLWRSLTYGKKQPLRRGETLAEVRPFTWKQRLGLVLLVSLLVGGYGWRNWRPDGAIGEGLPLFSAIEVTMTPTPIVPVLTPTPIVPATAVPEIIPPAVEPVAYNPDTAVANGDWAALVESFDVDAAIVTIEELSGRFNGRAAGTTGGYAAGDYIAAQFAQLGLQPVGTDGFYQDFPIHQTVLAGVPTLAVETADGVIDDYVLFQDFAPAVRTYMGPGVAEGPVVWANNCAREDFAGLDAAGKIVLCRGDWPRTEVSRNVLEHGAAALLLLAGPDSPALDFTPVYYDTWLPDTLPLPTFRISETVAEDLLVGSGRTVSELSINFVSFLLETAVRLEVNTTGPDLCPDGACTARNILGVLPGRDPAYADEVVILSAHYDHLGQSPDGTLWGGANDNASGVAAILEIARSWQVAGFVPRRTVLFAAWDAEEIGLLGSRYYVAQPQYGLENTVGIINLDMVGAGEETLYLSGAGLESQTLAVAATMGITATVSDSGRSDHYPFQQAGVPAGTLIWFGDGEVPDYHRPSDTPATIEPEKLAAVGRMAGLMALNLADTEPQIETLLAERAAAIVANDEADFLATSNATQRPGDRLWLADVAALSPISATLTADHLRVLGNTAVADTNLNLTYLAETSSGTVTRTLDVPLPARFTSGTAGWLWAGADLVTAVAQPGDTFTISYPANIPEIPNFQDVGLQISQQYTATASLLDLPTNPAARLILYPTADALRADTAVTLPDKTNIWVGPDTIKLIYSGPITSHQQLDTSITQLVLAEADVAEADAPWLWRGLPLAVAAESDWTAVQRENLPILYDTFAEAEFVRNAATDWAAVDYLRRQVGWEGLGQFITAVGERGLNAALLAAVGQTSAQFEAAWRQDWEAQLAGAETAVNDLLAARTNAILNPNRAAFLRTVDPESPLIYAEESDWFDNLGDEPPNSFGLTSELLALYEDGRVLTNITQVYEPVDGRGGTTQQEILFTPNENGLQWAGPPSETLIGQFVTVVYPPERLQAAEQFLALADAFVPQLADHLPLELAETETIRLPDDLTTGLPAQLARRQLAQFGVTDEWLLAGTAVYLAGQIDPHTAQNAAESLHNLWLGVVNGRIRGIESISDALIQNGEDAQKLALTQAWDTIRYLAQTHGEDALWALLRAQGRGQSLADALQSAIGQSPAEFDAAWEASLAQAHVQPDWIAIADGFDAAAANAHLLALTAPELAGRQAGSPGSALAADYIANQFAAYGLEPVVNVTPVISATDLLTGTAVAPPELSYFQTFTIEYAALTAVPQLTIGGENFGYRRDFLTLLDEIPGGGAAVGELVWVEDGSYVGMDLSGKIVIRKPETAVYDEMVLALEHHAAGLILVGDSDYEKDFQRKRPLPVNFPDDEMIPTLLLTKIGLEQLLEMTGMTSADLNTMPPALPLDLAVTLNIPLSQPEAVETANVLGLLPGSDSDLRDEVIILSAHYDHVGDDPGGLAYSGANDNASGVAVMLEIARQWQASGYQPARSILFSAWGAQEPGQIGASTYLTRPVLPITNTMGVVVLDAVGGGDGHRLMAQGVWEWEGLLLFGMEQADGVLDGRLRTNIPANQSDDIPFRAADLPTMLLTWTDASEENWSDAYADEVELDALAATGRMTILALMSVAR